MTFEGDEDNTQVPSEMFAEGDDEAVLAPVFVGHRMEAELIRSLLEANDIPAVVFGSGGLLYGAEDAGPTDRVMVRSDHVDIALQAIRDTDLAEDGVVEPDEDDFEVIEGADVDETGFEFEDEDTESEWSEVEILAERSDWGPRIVGLIGVAALVVAILVIVLQET